MDSLKNISKFQLVEHLPTELLCEIILENRVLHYISSIFKNLYFYLEDKTLAFIITVKNENIGTLINAFRQSNAYNNQIYLYIYYHKQEYQEYFQAQNIQMVLYLDNIKESCDLVKNVLYTIECKINKQESDVIKYDEYHEFVFKVINQYNIDVECKSIFDNFMKQYGAKETKMIYDLKHNDCLLDDDVKKQVVSILKAMVQNYRMIGYLSLDMPLQYLNDHDLKTLIKMMFTKRHIQFQEFKVYF